MVVFVSSRNKGRNNRSYDVTIMSPANMNLTMKMKKNGAVGTLRIKSKTTA